MTNVKFKELGLSKEILSAIEDLGYQETTEIQGKAIPILQTSEQDFIGQAQTGTGKTAAFLIPILEKIDTRSNAIQALILTPTRELAHQVEKEIVKLTKYLTVKSTCVYGGMSYDKQITALKKLRPQIVVGTPGRVIDLINKRFLNLDSARYCVLDEADEMLNMGFLDDVKIVLEKFKPDRQLIMFSATMPRAILSLINQSFNEYDIVKIQNKSLSNDDIEQKFFVVKDKYFKESIARLIDNAPEMYGIIFCRTKIETKMVGDELKNRGYSVEVLNGDMGQNERDYAMRNFKEKKVNILVCTDVAARGIDVTNLTHVFNYGLPQDNESYVHRIGRTGRAGMKGKAFTIVSSSQVFGIRRIEKHINNKIELSKLPTVKELKTRLVEKELSSVGQIKIAVKEKGEEFKTDEAYTLFKEQFDSLDKDEILKLMFSWKFNKSLRHYDFLPDIEALPKSSRQGFSSRGSRGPRNARGGSGGGGYRGGNRQGGRSGGGSRDRDRDRDRDGNRSGGTRSGAGSTRGGSSRGARTSSPRKFKRAD